MESGNDISLSEDLFFMVPDEVNFGPSITFGGVRELRKTDVVGCISLLRDRLADRLIEQVEPREIKELALERGIAFPKPFPLAVLACVGFEALGKIFFEEPANSRDNSHQQFVEALKLADPIFSVTYTEEFLAALKRLSAKSHPSNYKVQNYGFLVFKFFRNSMIHGYRTSAVFLKHDMDLLVRVEEGGIILNPNIFWEKFKQLFNRLFDDVINNADSPYRECCQKYIDDMLN